MNKGLQVREGVKSSCSNSFRLFNKIANILRHFGTKIFRLTIHNSRLTELVAFTLAETLIVMGVIGIVSALTLPNLNSSTGDKEKVAKVKKIYQNLNDAFGRAEAVYGPYDEWFLNDTTEAAKAKRAGERITEFMKLSKTCALNANQGCIQNSADDAVTSIYKVITADGTSVYFKDGGGSTTTIDVDIDGPSKGAYTSGKDRFQFSANRENAVVPMGYNSTFSDLLADVKSGGGRSMTATWIIKFDNADYLKLGTDSKCPNGTTPTEANPRCK